MAQIHPLLSLYALSAAVAFSAAIGSWQRRHRSSAAAALCLVMVGLTWWSMSSAAQMLLPNGPARLASAYAVYPGVATVVAGTYCEMRALTDRDWRLSRRTIALLCIHPVLLHLAILSDPWHHLFLTRIAAIPGQQWLLRVPGPLFWVHTAYCYTVLAWCLAAVLRSARLASSPLHRRQLRSMVLGGLIPSVANVYAVVVRRHQMSPDITSCFFVVTGVIHYYGVFRQGLFRLLPVARGLVMEHVSDAIYVIDITGRVIDINSAAQRLTRRLSPGLPADLVGLPARELVPHNRTRRILTDGQYHVDGPGGAIDLDLRVNDLADKHGQALGRVVVIRDVTELNAQRRELAQVNDRLLEQLATIEQLQHDLAEQAVRDELTGLHNRRHLITQLEADLIRARSHDSWLSVILLDIDHFKSVNDRFGHAVGDDLLAATAKALSGCVRFGDTIARYGGEEFVVVLPGATMEDALATAEALRRRCAGVLVESRHGPVSTTMSAGVASFPLCGWTGSELLQAADEALYAAKAAGRDQVFSAAI